MLAWRTLACEVPNTHMNQVLEVSEICSVTAGAKWRCRPQGAAESWPRRQTIRLQLRPIEGFNCADDVFAPLHWAPDSRHKSGRGHVRAIIVDALCLPGFTTPVSLARKLEAPSPNVVRSRSVKPLGQGDSARPNLKKTSVRSAMASICHFSSISPHTQTHPTCLITT